MDERNKAEFQFALQDFMSKTGVSAFHVRNTHELEYLKWQERRRSQINQAKQFGCPISRKELAEKTDEEMQRILEIWGAKRVLTLGGLVALAIADLISP